MLARTLADIARFEDYLTRQGVVVLKFCLNLSRQEQKKRFTERLDKPDKYWKFSAADVRERRHWDDYMHAYEEAICATASKDAPWFVVPADNKWFSRLVVAAAIVEGGGAARPRISESHTGPKKGTRRGARGASCRQVG